MAEAERAQASPRWTRSLSALLQILLIVQALFFALHTIQVIRFPHDVDNEEGFLLWQSLQFAEGHWPYQPIDDPPYVVANYPPLYPLLCSLGTRFVGPSFVIGRTVSFLATLGVTLGIFLMVFRQSQQKAAAVIAGLFFIGTYHVYTWGGFHRVDMLALFFSVVSLALCIAQSHWVWILLSCSLALFTRQTALAAPLAISCYWLSQQRRRSALCLWLGLIALVGSGSLLLNTFTQGEYLRHTVTYNRNEFTGWTIFYYARHLWQFYAILCALGLFYFLRAFQLRRWDLNFWFLIFSTASACLCGKIGSAPNYLLELIVALCWITGAVMAELRTLPTDAKHWLELLLPVLLILQVLESFHLPHLPPVLPTARFDFAWTPTREDLRREEVLSYRIRHTPGPVLIEDAGVALRAGREVVYQPFICTQLERQGLWDPTPVLRRIENKEFSFIALHVNMDEATVESDRFSQRMIQTVKKNYFVDEVLPGFRTFYFHRPRPGVQNGASAP